jgi:hypothetical protein
MLRAGCWITWLVVTGGSTQAHGHGMPPQPATAVVAAVSPAAMTQNAGEIAARLDKIDAAVERSAEKQKKTDYVPAVLSLLGTLGGIMIGAVVTFLTQTRLFSNQQKVADQAAKQARELADQRALHERELASNRAKLEIGNSLVQWQLKQLSELYGPLRALLGQSLALYRHMNMVLARSDVNRFRLRRDVRNSGADQQVFEIFLSAQWVRFRTILHIGNVYGCGYGIESYFDGVVACGARMVKVIEEKAGYIRPEQGELGSVFGQYLAHYSVLEKLHAYVKAKREDQPEEPLPMAVVESAVFPTEIDMLIDSGFQAIRAELEIWRARAGSFGA